jgi:hypothetical protein
MINTNPTTLPIVNVSFRSQTPRKNTIAGAKLINGYASVISNFDMAAIQKSEATKAETKPENIKGSNINRIKAENLLIIPFSGNLKLN